MSEALPTHSYREERNKRQNSFSGPETSKWEWFTEIHRDTYAVHLGNNAHMIYYSTIKNLSEIELRNEFISSMVLPCGLPEEQK